LDNITSAGLEDYSLKVFSMVIFVKQEMFNTFLDIALFNG
jgi:hypothetical protein